MALILKGIRNLTLKKKKSKLIIRIFLIFIVLSIVLINFNATSAKAGYDINVDKEETYVYRVTDCNGDAMNSIDPKYKLDAEEGEKCCYKIYDRDKRSQHYTVRYKMWDWTDDENTFYQDYDSKNKLYVPKFGYMFGMNAESIHNNSDILMSIVMCDVEDYLGSIDWNPAKVYQFDRTVIKIESSYDVYYEYSKEGFLKEYYIVSSDEIIFRAIYIGNLENPTENNLLFDIIPLIIISSIIIGLTMISALIVKKISGKNKYTIDKIVEKEETLK